MAKIIIEVSEELLALLLGGLRCKGSLALDNPDEAVASIAHPKGAERPAVKAEFRAYPRRKYSRRLTYQLPHGRVTVSGGHVALKLVVPMSEGDVVPAQVVEDESRDAGEIIDRVIDGMWEYPYGINLIKK